MEKQNKFSGYLQDQNLHKTATTLDAELKLELTKEQRMELIKFVESKGRFPSAIEMNIETGMQGEIQRSTLFPVTVLVGAMA